MKVDILTLFPEMFEGPFDTSMIKRAKDSGVVEINIYNLRDWAKDKHKTVDDRPFGGGYGMVIRVDVVDKALEQIKSIPHKVRSPQLANLKRDDEADLRSLSASSKAKPHVILLSPQGQVFSQRKARELAKLDHLILVAGHYEGFDERIRENLIDEELSIGDYVLTGGEIPAMVVVDSVTRLLPGVLEKEAKEHESFSKMDGVFDYPTYTRPPQYKGWKVPEVLVSGNHAEIERWRGNKSFEKTKKIRPELVKDS